MRPQVARHPCKCIVILALGCASLSQAALNFNLDALDPLAVTQGSSVMFTGTIQLSAGWDATSAVLEHPGNGVDYLTPTFAPAFLNYLALNTSATYSGDIFSVAAGPSATLGLYDQNTYSGGLTDLSEMMLFASKGNQEATDNEIFAVEVEAVPEPGTIAALGLGAAAFARRRRSSK